MRCEGHVALPGRRVATARLAAALALAVAALAGCAWLPSPAPSETSATADAPSASPSQAAEVPLQVRMAGKIACASFPYGCTATVSVLPADAPVPDAWRPPATDPVWVPDYSNGWSTADHFVSMPTGGHPALPPGPRLVVVSLLGSYDMPSLNPDGTWATDLLSRCTALVEVSGGSRPLSAVVTFTPNGKDFGGTCSIKVAGS